MGLCGREDTQKGLGIAGQVCQTRQNKTRQGKKKSTWLCFGFLFITFPTADLVCVTLAEIPEEESPRRLPAGMASPKQAFGHLPTRGRCSPSNHPISTFSSQGRPTGSKPGDNIHLCWLLKFSSSAEMFVILQRFTFHSLSNPSLASGAPYLVLSPPRTSPLPLHHPLWSVGIVSLFF